MPYAYSDNESSLRKVVFIFHNPGAGGCLSHQRVHKRNVDTGEMTAQLALCTDTQLFDR